MTISSASPPPAPHRGTLAWAIAVLFGVTGLGSAAVAVALPAIATDLDLTVGRAALVVSCYSLALAVGSAIFGRLGDFFGIRLPLLVGMSVMVTAACAGALVDSLPALIATRTLQGLGAAAVPALTLAAVQALFAGDSRARAMATYSSIGATINALGPVAGALLVDPFGWRPVVAIPLLTLLVVPLVWRDLPTDRQQGATLDPVGVALVGGAAIGAVLSLQAATLGPVVAAAGGALLLVCAPTAVLRSRWRPHGVVPAGLVRNRAARRSLLTAVSLPAAWFGMLVAVPTVLTASDWSGAAVGMLLVPCAALGIIAPRITGPTLIRLGAPRSQLLATIGVTLAIILAALGAARVDAVALIAATLVLILAFGLGQPAMTALVVDSVPVNTRGGALGLLTLVFLLGGSLGAAAVGGLGEAIGFPSALLALAVLPLTAALAFARPLPSTTTTPGDPVTDTDHVLYDLTDGIATITLNRPDRRNAMSVPMIERLGELLARADEDPAVRVLVLTGAGRAFCAGGDVQQFDEDGGEGGGANEVDSAAVAEQVRHQELTVGRLHAFTKPTIAAIPGAAAGAGLGLALATDLRIGTPRTVVATAFTAVALSGDFGVAWLLDRLVGPAHARELLLLNPRLDGQACLNLNLLTRLVPEEELAQATTELATRLANGPALTLAHIKSNLREAPHQTLSESMASEVPRHKECGLTDDHVEAARAFVEKRPPVFAR